MGSKTPSREAVADIERRMQELSDKREILRLALEDDRDRQAEVARRREAGEQVLQDDGRSRTWDVIELELGSAGIDLLEAAGSLRMELEAEAIRSRAAASYLSGEAERLRRQAERCEADIAKLGEQVARPLCQKMGKGDTARINTGIVNVALYRPPPRVEVDDDAVALLPEALTRTTIEPSKTAIRDALNLCLADVEDRQKSGELSPERAAEEAARIRNGEVIEGCKLVQGPREVRWS